MTKQGLAWKADKYLFFLILTHGVKYIFGVPGDWAMVAAAGCVYALAGRGDRADRPGVGDISDHKPGLAVLVGSFFGSARAA